MKPWLLSHSSDYPPALIMGSARNYISCPSPLIRLANACERWSGVAVTESQICFDSPRCHLLVVSDRFSFFLRAGCAFPGGSRPKTKPGNKGSISKLIRLQTCFGRTNHFITSFTIGHHRSSEKQYFITNFLHLGCIHNFCQ